MFEFYEKFLLILIFVHFSCSGFKNVDNINVNYFTQKHFFKKLAHQILQDWIWTIFVFFRISNLECETCHKLLRKSFIKKMQRCGFASFSALPIISHFTLFKCEMYIIYYIYIMWIYNVYITLYIYIIYSLKYKQYVYKST